MTQNHAFTLLPRQISSLYVKTFGRLVGGSKRLGDAGPRSLGWVRVWLTPLKHASASPVLRCQIRSF